MSNYQRRTNGPTPNGGSYAIAYFRDASGAPCPESDAASIEIVEFDESGKAIARTYGGADHE